MRGQRIWFGRVLALFALTASLAVALPQASNAATTLTAPKCACSIKATPTSGKPGTLVAVKGARFAAGGLIRIRFVDSKGTRWTVAKPKNVKVASNGTFTAKVRVPKPATKGVGRFVAVETTGTYRAVRQFLVT